MRTFFIAGLGCPKNQVDSEVLWGQLAAAGMLAVDDPAAAELIIVNTCAFIQPAVEESLDTIVELARYRQAGTCRRLVVAGCLTARYRDGLLPDLPEVDAFIGPAEVGQLDSLLGRSGESGQRLRCAAQAAFLPDADTPRVNSLSTGAAYLKVAEGCSRQCSFCIIPRLRGPQVSRSIADLVRQAENLVALGVVELVLVAQDLVSWGRDLPGRPGLSELVQALADVPGLDWLRLMYLFPGQVPDALIRLMADRNNILPYLDIPLQHVDREVLRRMRRAGDAEACLRLVERLRGEVPGVVLRTSLMTGFPGEDRAAFEMLFQFVEQARFERLGVFAFSAEEGTLAAGMPDQVDPEEAEERRRLIMDRQRLIAEDYHKTLIGQRLPVLVEGFTEDGRLAGRAFNQAPEVDGVTVLRGQAAVGQLVSARVVAGDAYDLEAEVVDDEA